MSVLPPLKAHVHSREDTWQTGRHVPRPFSSPPSLPWVWVLFLVQIAHSHLNIPPKGPLRQGLCGHQALRPVGLPTSLDPGNSELGGDQISHLAQLPHFVEKTEPKVQDTFTGMGGVS